MSLLIIKQASPLIFLILILIGLQLLFRYNKYKKSDYRNESGNSFFNTFHNKGNYGEFLTFLILERLKPHKRILTNLYIPKEDGTTTEIDLLMIIKSGIYVFESKNYSGWIFGDDKSKYWTQTLKGGKKSKFINPIIQNRAHISALKKVFDKVNEETIYSVIVFSERCELRKITLSTSKVTVLKRGRLERFLNDDIDSKAKLLNDDQIDNCYEILKVYAHADEMTKQQHIQSIKSR